MKLAILGASRGIGRIALDLALERGHHVNALSRTVADVPEHPQLVALAGDATDPLDLARAVEGTDAVLMTLGVPRNWRVLRPTTLFSSATQALLPVMEASDVRRLLVVTGFGAGESYVKLSSPERLLLKTVLGRAYADKDLQEELIIGSDLDWTIARPGILTDGSASRRYKVLADPSTWRQGMVSRADVAHFLITAAEDGTYVRQAPAIQR